MIFTLLDKVVAVYVRLIRINVWSFGLEGSFSRFVEVFLSNRRSDF